jgi:hypothetical protein
MKETKTTKKTTKSTNKTKLAEMTATVSTNQIDFDFLRKTQTRPLRDSALEEFIAEYSAIVELEKISDKYFYGHSVIINNKKYATIWAKTDCVRFTIAKRHIEALKDCKINLAERTAIKNDNEILENEFVVTREEMHDILHLIKAYAERLAEQKKKAEEESKSKAKQEQKKKAKQSKAKKETA